MILTADYQIKRFYLVENGKRKALDIPADVQAEIMRLVINDFYLLTSCAIQNRYSDSPPGMENIIDAEQKIGA